MSTITPYVITGYADRIDQIAVRRYGTSAGTVVHILDSNPGLEKHGIVLPPGLKILLPDLPVSSTTTTTVRTGVGLWD